MLTPSPTHAFLQVDSLPPACQPAWVVRRAGAVLLTVDPGATCADVVAWSVDNLTPAELNAYRDGYGQPSVGLPLDDVWMTDMPFPQHVPFALRLPQHRIAVTWPQRDTA